MRSIEEALRKGKLLRTIGFDDSPFEKKIDTQVGLAGVVCSGTRFEGMLYGSIEHDGLDATAVMIEMLRKSKFKDQLNLILTDGLTVGGFNVIDLSELAEAVQIPCIALMRKLPNLDAFYLAMENVGEIEKRKSAIANAGEIHSQGGFNFQAVGIVPELAVEALGRVTDTGDVPECLRLAHLIGAAVKTGESGKRA